MAFSSSFVSSFKFLWSSYKKRLNIKWLLLSKSKINNLAGFLLYRWLLLPILSSTDSIYTYINYNCSCKPDRISCTCLISVLGLNFWICLEFQWKTEKKTKILYILLKLFLISSSNKGDSFTIVLFGPLTTGTALSLTFCILLASGSGTSAFMLKGLNKGFRRSEKGKWNLLEDGFKGLMALIR